MENLRSATLRRFSSSIASMLRQGIQDEQEEELTLEATYDEQGLLRKEWKMMHGETSAEVHSYTYDSEGRLTEHYLAIPDDGIEERFVTQRNADGKPVEIQKFYGEDPGERTVYAYGENAEVKQVTAYDADGDFDHEELLEYDEKSRMISRTTRKSDDSKSKLSYTYNEQGLLAQITETNEAGKQISSQVHDYTVEGLEARIRQFNESGKQISEVTSEYDSTGRLIRKRSSGFYVRISIFEYNEQGNLTEESLSDDNGFVISRNRYEYDADNRLISETIYETDLTRGGRDTHYSNRYEYQFD